MRKLVRDSGRYRDFPFGPWLTNVLALLHRTSQSLSLLTGRLMLGAILLDTTQESRLASWTMEVLSLMPESGTDRDPRTLQIDETVRSPNQVLDI